MELQGLLGSILIAALAAFMIFRRFRRLRAPRRVRPLLMAVRITVMSLIGFVMFWVPWGSPPWFGGALALGIALGLYALTRVEFEQREQGTFFRSRSFVGIFVFALFVTRLVWRMSDRLLNGQPPWARRFADPDAAMPERAPVTLILLFVFFGYVICYNAGILIRSKSLQPAGS